MNYLYQNLERELAQEILQGRLPAGSKLPSIRYQCEQLGLSKATVIHAYQRLEAAGLIEARFKSGFYVVGQGTNRPIPSESLVHSEPQLVDTSDLMRDIMEHSAAFDIAPQGSHSRDLPTGIVELNRSIARALRSQKEADHQYYDEPAGVAEIREQIAERYQRLGCRFTSSEVTMSAGCQHGLALALQMCCQPGDIVAVESPGFYGVLQLIESMGLKVLEIPVSAQHGMSINALETAAQNWNIKACVVTPSFATPTGACLPIAQRHQLLALSEEKDFMVIEDDIYGDLSFSQRIPPLKQLDRQGKVILCGSFSKALSRDVRMGWVVTEQFRQLRRLKMINLLAVCKFVQRGLVDFIADGSYDKHLRKQKFLLQQQRDQLIALLDQYWTPLGEVRVSQPQGGIALWVELEDRYDLNECYLQARSEGILITPGNLFTAQDRFKNCLRLSFAHNWSGPRVKALIRLAEIIKAGH
ncbi:PLP-dependent aminotransferase family protein [Neptuniibacter caesariensis]|nr:PLP-dependent aminotransferase family protein [Neptuniibacter caesariensis]